MITWLTMLTGEWTVETRIFNQTSCCFGTSVKKSLFPIIWLHELLVTQICRVPSMILNSLYLWNAVVISLHGRIKMVQYFLMLITLAIKRGKPYVFRLQNPVRRFREIMTDQLPLLLFANFFHTIKFDLILFALRTLKRNLWTENIVS